MTPTDTMPIEAVSILDEYHEAIARLTEEAARKLRPLLGEDTRQALDVDLIHIMLRRARRRARSGTRRLGAAPHWPGPSLALEPPSGQRWVGRSSM